MGYAKHVGRVGALAVTLGVGVAIVTMPGLAYADPSDGSSGGDSSSSAGAGDKDVSKEKADKDKAKPESKPEAKDESKEKGDKKDEAKPDDTQEQPKDEDTSKDEAVPESADPEPPVIEPSVSESDPTPEIEGGTESVDESKAAVPQKDSHRAAPVHVVADAPDPVSSPSDDDPPAGASDDPTPMSLASTEDSVATGARDSTAVFTTVATALKSVAPPPATVQAPKTIVGAVTDFVAALFGPILSPAQGSPIQFPILTAVLSAVRNEFERILFPRKATANAQQNVTLLADPPIDPTTQHVLLIGVDGTNLSRILADPDNENFIELMGDSTNAASSIVGHTTISNPSWTAILTGVWGERTGVINNVFTPWTYDTWPTVFNQLEALEQPGVEIDTMTVADWNVINAIAAAGSDPVDENLYVAQLPGDTNWLDTDDKVADLTIDAISDPEGAPNFLFSYYVGVDENGHMYGGDSPEYKAAIENMDDNLGDIMDAIDAWEAAHPGEEWTVIVVTDHGHQPQQGFGHGFQSPDETATFVIARGKDFEDGYINEQYEIVDTTPTVVSLFGGTPRAGSDGVPLQTLGPGVVSNDLKADLEAAIAQNTSPDFVANVALSLRTIFATVPYYVYEFGNDTTADLPQFLVLPAQVVFDGLYVLTNVPAQIVAFLTGVSGASLFPLLPPEPPNFPDAGTSDAMLLGSLSWTCVGAAAESQCGEPSVA